MIGKKDILKALNIKDGEGLTIILLMLYSFFMGATVAFFYTASTSIMLTNFDKEILPYTYIGGGLAAYLFWGLYSMMEKKLKFSNLLVFANAFLVISVTILVWGVINTDNKWFSFIMYVWIRIFSFVTFVGFWGIASRIFDIRQGKRLFGLISTGEVISDIIGFFSIPLLLNFIRTEDLLYISIFGLFVCIIMVYIINKKFRKELSLKVRSTEPESEVEDGEEPAKEANTGNYYIYLGLMAFLPMISIAFADYLFMVQTQVQYTDKEVLSEFLGIFFGMTAVAEFLVKTFLSGKLLSKYGIKIGLAAAPFLLFISIGLASASGIIYGVTAMFSSFILLSKILERVMRTAIYDPSFQILYQPLTASKRLFFQSRVEGIAKTGGNIFAGFALLLLLSFDFFNSIVFTLFYAVILLIWLKYTFTTHEKYRDSLRNILFHNKSKHYDSTERKIVNKEVLNTSSVNKNNFEILYYLISYLYPDQVTPIALSILGSLNEDLKESIVRKLENKEIILPSGLIDKFTGTETDEMMYNRLLMLRTITRDIETTDFNDIKTLALSARIDDRILAAQLLSISKRFGTYKILAELYNDEEPEVKAAAIYAMGMVFRPELWKLLVDSLKYPKFRNSAITSILSIGEPIIPYLIMYFNRFNTTKDHRILIIKIISHIGGNGAIQHLKDKLTYPEKETRDEVIRALSLLHYKASSLDETIIKNLIEESIETLIWIMAAILDLEEHYPDSLLVRSLYYEIDERRKQIFQMLSMLYDSETIQYIWDNIESESSDARVLSLELIDIFLSTELKENILILFEEISFSECIDNFKDIYPQKKMKPEDRLVDIINKDFTRMKIWTKACAFDMITKQKSNYYNSVYQANINNPNLIISELSVYAMYKLDVNKYKDFVSYLPYDDRKRIGTVLARLLNNRYNSMTYFDIVNAIKNTEIFGGVNQEHLIKLATRSVLIDLDKGELLNCRSGLCLYILLSGSITEAFGKTEYKEYFTTNGPNPVIFSLGSRRLNQHHTAMAESLLIEIPFETIYDLNMMSDDAQIYSKILGYNYKNYEFYDLAYENKIR